MSTYTLSFTARNTTLSEKKRQRVADKLQHVAKHDPSLTFVRVEFLLEPNPRRGDATHKVAIVAQGSGHVTRVDAAAESFVSAENQALEKLRRALRKVKSQRVHAKSGHRRRPRTGEVSTSAA